VLSLITRWQWHPVLVACLLSAAIIHAAIWWQHSRRPLSLAAWNAGLLAVAIAGCSILDPLSDVRLAAHMVQHEVLTFAAAPLLVAGMRPVTLAVLPRLGPVARWGHWVTRPRIAWGVAAVTLWAWHWPPAYDVALAHPAVHDIEHATLLAAYALYWSPFVGFGHAVAALRTDATRILYLATGGTQSGLLGAVLAFRHTPSYPHYVDALGGGASALGDQQLAGLIMLVSGAAVFALAAPLVLRGK